METTDGKPDEWTGDEELMINKAASKVQQKQDTIPEKYFYTIAQHTMLRQNGVPHVRPQQ